VQGLVFVTGHDSITFQLPGALCMEKDGQCFATKQARHNIEAPSPHTAQQLLTFAAASSACAAAAVASAAASCLMRKLWG
jgi:hypothetical protein